MGAFLKLIDALLFIYFTFIAIVAPLIDGQLVLPKHIFPSVLVDLKASYAQDYNDYLVSEQPHFLVGLVWLELLFQWPLVLASVYGILAGKSWVSTTCLMYGLTGVTSMVAILSELKLSGRASDQLLMIYFPFLGFSLLALLRGLLSCSGKSTSSGKRTVVLSRKKRA